MTSTLEPSAPGLYVAPAPTFTCGWSTRGKDLACVHAKGDLDRGTAPVLGRTLRQAQRATGLVVLDLRDLEFIDCAGLHAIFEANERARRSAGRLAVVRGAPRVDRVFELTRFDALLEMVDLHPAEPPVQALLKLDECQSA